MTNNKLTDEQIAIFTNPPTNWPCPGSAGDIMSMAKELQERRKADAPGDFLSRMRGELSQINARRKGLHAFIGTPSFKALSESARAAQIRQQDVMDEYANILHIRIRLAEEE